MKLIPAEFPSVFCLELGPDDNRLTRFEVNNTCELLERLQSHACKLSLENRGPQTIHVGTLPLGHLKLMGRSKFSQLGRNGIMVSRQASKTAERQCRLFLVVLLDQIPRCLGKQQQAGEEDQRPCQLDRHGNTVTPRVISVRSRVVHDGREEQADGDGPLIRTDDEAADPFGSRLGLVEWDWGTRPSADDF